MSDEIESKPTEPTVAEKTETRANELRKYKGKFFRQKNSSIQSPIVEIIDYGGVKVKTVAKDGQLASESSHTFICEMKGARWTPAATAFLAAYDEVPVPAKNIQNQEPV